MLYIVSYVSRDSLGLNSAQLSQVRSVCTVTDLRLGLGANINSTFYFLYTSIAKTYFSFDYTSVLRTLLTLYCWFSTVAAS